MDVFDRRRAKLRELLLKMSAAELSRASDVDPTYISRCLKEPGERGYKNMGELTARKLERGARKPEGWMDGNDVVVIEGPPETPGAGGNLVINQFDTGGAMGHGLVLNDQPGVIRRWIVSPEWVQLNVHRITSANNLAIVTGFGDSMRPLYNPGDPLLVDRGVTRADIDGIYFFRVGDEGFVKRLQRIPTVGGTILRAKSDNNKYDPFDIVKGMDFEIFGRVVKAWCGEDF